MAQIELIGSEYNPKAAPEKATKTEAGKGKGVGARLRAAAERLRGRKAAADADTHEKADKRMSGKSKARSSSQKKPG